MPFDKYKIRLVNEHGDFLGYRCELCGFEVHVTDGRYAQTASSAMTNHIKSAHAKEYEEHFGHPPIWRYKNWTYDIKNGEWAWRRKKPETVEVA